MREKIEWYCPKCRRFVENPNPVGITMVGVSGQMSCDVCGNWLMKFKEEKHGD